MYGKYSKILNKVCIKAIRGVGRIATLQFALCDETKMLTDTNTKTFYQRPIFPIPIPLLFSENKFSDTDTETLKQLS